QRSWIMYDYYHFKPSTDVLTEKLKTFMPTRIAFATASSTDSKTIIDQSGAEKLLGCGDFLFKKDADDTVLRRIQGSHIGDDDVAKLTDYLRLQRPPYYDDLVISNTVKLSGAGGIEPTEINVESPDYKFAVDVVLKAGKASTSLLQRSLRIGYGRAARYIQMMEDDGIVGPADGSNPRAIYITGPINTKRKILFIEDDKALAKVYSTAFEQEGYEVKTCFDGEIALQKVLKFDPDMVVTGILMPKVSGFDVIDILKNTPETKRIPIIVLSALKLDRDKARAKRLGAIDYIVKSEVVIADVKKIIKRHMDEIYGTEYSMYENSDDYDAKHNENETIVKAVEIVIEAKKASTALLQRRMSIGYGKAARLIEIMEDRGYIGPADGSRPREVLIDNINQM
ncbi:MAG: segregation ATPase FtsK/SpoIIIE, family, partial [Patescibacteria group bacterium]|nr:segregation ATPase FtsK/SpoIIIE, family [Patescibacteria group bacterium]